MLVNSINMIDQTYTGDLMIVLVQIDANAEPIVPLL